MTFKLNSANQDGTVITLNINALRGSSANEELQENLKRALTNIEHILFKAKIFEAEFNTNKDEIVSNITAIKIKVAISVDEKYLEKFTKVYEELQTGGFIDYVPGGFGQALTCAVKGFINPVYFHDIDDKGFYSKAA